MKRNGSVGVQEKKSMMDMMKRWRYDEILWRFYEELMENWWRIGGDLMRFDGDLMVNS